MAKQLLKPIFVSVAVPIPSCLPMIAFAVVVLSPSRPVVVRLPGTRHIPLDNVPPALD